MSAISLVPLAGIPELAPGEDLAGEIAAALARARPGQAGVPLAELVLAVAHTAVSKVEGATVDLATVAPGERALALAAGHEKDPRLVQVVLDQSEEILRAERGVLICRTRHGFVCANAGVDVSNAGAADRAILLPEDPDGSARALRQRIGELAGEQPPAVLVTDSFGRAWRHGQVDVAVGLAGMGALEDWRGRTDAEGRELRATWLAVADAAAAAADLARTKDSGQPVVAIAGLARHVTAQDGPGAAALLRPPAEDMFL
jgi:coenzyme F420-0:L-glutamate ligase/coenzyme F420-1:gamma-L-glutamate ligase